jgi:hypothetical protein
MTWVKPRKMMRRSLAAVAALLVKRLCFMLSFRSPRRRAPLWCLIPVLAIIGLLAACGGSSGSSSTDAAGAGGTQSSGSGASRTTTGGSGNGSPATVVSGDFTLQAGSFYDRAAANLAGTADHYNLQVDGDGLEIIGEVAELSARTTGSYRVCSHTQPQVNLGMTVTWSELAASGQYCVSDSGLQTISLLTVRGASPDSRVTLHVDTWLCADEDCWSVSGAS